ncbi:MAG TPA: hypothetical protein VNU01_13460 [Egibacteraceae bacterium]|nr:hypothetical protein [Egibacteraceae bacterium]
MITTSRSRAVAIAAAALLLALLTSACGDPPATDPGDDAIVPPGEMPAQTAVDVTVDNGDGQASFRLVCDDAPRFEGEAGERDAAAACDALLQAKDRLVTLSDPDREPEMCTEQYGGPETAAITGTVEGEQVDVAIDRTNGCGIGDWERLQPLLGEPTGVAEPVS